MSAHEVPPGAEANPEVQTQIFELKWELETLSKRRKLVVGDRKETKTMHHVRESPVAEAQEVDKLSEQLLQASAPPRLKVPDWQAKQTPFMSSNPAALKWNSRVR